MFILWPAKQARYSSPRLSKVLFLSRNGEEDPSSVSPSTSLAPYLMPEIGKYGTHNPLFGRYVLDKLLGYGAFAKVYRARDLQSGHSVAIKIISKNKLTGAACMSNIKREISIMRRLRHPNIVCLHQVLANKSKIFFVMEFLKGGELFSKIANGRFTEDLSRKYFQQLISAVGFCHSRGVFHRDLKPENLLVDENDNLKVSDFGLSAVAGQIGSDGLLHTLCGTPAFVAPEMLTKKGYDGAKVDVWSCGVILFVLNAGYLPFNHPNVMAMYKKIYKGEYRCPRWMSPDLRRFLSRLLHTNPQTRITIDEILKDPWFTKGGFEEMIKVDDVRTKLHDKEDPKSKILNAFDIISLSPGLDLSGLFGEAHNSVENSERFVAAETPQKIIEIIEEICKKEKLRTKKKELAMSVEVGDGNSVIGIELYRLTEGMVMVEVRKRGGDGVFYREIWKKKLRAQLVGSLAHPEPEASSSQQSLAVEAVE